LSTGPFAGESAEGSQFFLVKSGEGPRRCEETFAVHPVPGSRRSPERPRYGAFVMCAGCSLESERQ